MASSRRWTEFERRELLAACAQSDLSVKAFAESAGVPYTTLVYWKRRVAAKSSGRFVPVEIEQREAACIEVVVGDIVLRVANDFDDAHLVRVVRALREC